jgi:GMP synthase-like glutamine amidotransferase
MKYDQERRTWIMDGEAMDRGLYHSDPIPITARPPESKPVPVKKPDTFITFFEHDAEGTPGRMVDLCRAQGIPYEILPLYNPKAPALNPDTTHLIVLGGDQEMDDLAKVKQTYPNFDWELQVIKSFIEAKKPVLGICLGAEIIAVALGIKVEKKGREYGWSEVQSRLPGLPETVHVFKYHDDSFALPEGAQLLMTSDTVRNQCFTFDRVVGTQFHPEVTPKMVYQWTKDPALWDPSHRYDRESAAVASSIFNFFMSLGAPVLLHDGARNAWVVNIGTSFSGNWGHSSTSRKGEVGGSDKMGSESEFKPSANIEEAMKVTNTHIGMAGNAMYVHAAQLEGASLGQLNAINAGLHHLGKVKVSGIGWMTDDDLQKYPTTDGYYDSVTNQIRFSKPYCDDVERRAGNSQRNLMKQLKNTLERERTSLKIIDEYGEDGAKARGVYDDRKTVETRIRNGESIQRWSASTDPSLHGDEHIKVMATHEALHAVHEQGLKDRWQQNLKLAVQRGDVTTADVYAVSQYSMSSGRPSEIFSEVGACKIHHLKIPSSIGNLWERTVREGPLSAREMRALLEDDFWDHALSQHRKLIT